MTRYISELADATTGSVREEYIYLPHPFLLNVTHRSLIRTRLFRVDIVDLINTLMYSLMLYILLLMNNLKHMKN